MDTKNLRLKIKVGKSMWEECFRTVQKTLLRTGLVIRSRANARNERMNQISVFETSVSESEYYRLYFFESNSGASEWCQISSRANHERVIKSAFFHE